MSLALVPRSARALSEHLNRMYRVFKGIDPDSVILRLPTSGSFEVRHSVTAVPVFRVTDTGTALSIGPEDIPPSTITSSHIADGTIDTADLKDGAVTSAKIGDLSITAGDLADGAVTSAKILDLTIVNGDIAAAAAIALSKLAPGTAGVLKSNGTVVSAGNQIVSGDITDGTIDTADLKDGAVTSLKIGDLSITSGDLADGAVTSAKILDLTIVNGDIAAAAGIDGSKLLDNSVPAIKLVGGGVPDNSVTSAKIVDGAIATVDLAPNAVTRLQQAIGSTPGHTTTLASPGGIAEMLLVVTPQAAGNLILIMFETTANLSAGGTEAIFDLYIANGYTSRRQMGFKAAGSNETILLTYLYTALSTVAVQVDVRFWVTAPGPTLTCTGTSRSLTVIEFKR